MKKAGLCQTRCAFDAFSIDLDEICVVPRLLAGFANFVGLMGIQLVRFGF